jgi:hypothetical protein
LLSREFPVGPDATNATEQLYDLVGDDQLFDDLQELAVENGNADVRELVIARLQEFAGDPDVDAVLSQISDPTSGELDDTQAPEQDMAEGEVYDLEKEYGAPAPAKKQRSQDPDDHNPYPYSRKRTMTTSVKSSARTKPKKKVWRKTCRNQRRLALILPTKLNPAKIFL